MFSLSVDVLSAHYWRLRFTETENINANGSVRKHRIYSRILMSSVGEPLWAADSVVEFLESVLDAVLGEYFCCCGAH